MITVMSEKMTRRDLVDRLAYKRADYELRYAAYAEDGWTPMVPFVKSETFGLAKHYKIDRVTAAESHPGSWSFHARVDWKKLAADVAAKVPRMKSNMIEFGHAPEPVERS